jgi:molybdopterin-guanine dinucleotide biosynthesis protein A
MVAESLPLSVVILAAGSSARMGSAKHLLPFHDGVLSYQNRLLMLQRALPDAKSFCIFLKSPHDQDIIQNPPGLDISCIFESTLDTVGFQGQSTILGSMAGLLSAFHFDPSSAWLVLPCDYPLMTAEEVKRLRAQYESPVTCLENGQGLMEPYAAIWSPEALAVLRDQVLGGLTDYRTVPRNAITNLGGKLVRPLYYHSLFNANTREDWDHAMGLLARQNLDTAS